MNIEQAITSYSNIKPNKELISHIDVEYFFEFAETVITAYEKEKEKNKELEKENKKLNLVRLQYLVSSFPDTTETYKKYKKELDEAIANLKEE